MARSTLRGITVVCFESRKSGMVADLIEQHDGIVISAPSMQEVPLELHEKVFEFARRLLDGQVDILVCLTGVGTRMMLEVMESRHDRDSMLGALSKVKVVARGPKPAAVLREYRIAITETVPEPNTWRELLQVLDKSPKLAPVEGKVIAVQEYGEPNPELTFQLGNRKAQVVPVQIYRWALPDDLQPLEEGIQALLSGQARAALFTSRRQIDHVLQVAARRGLEDQLRKALDEAVVGSIGPVCSEALQARGIRVDFQPKRPKLGPFVREAAGQIPRILTEMEKKRMKHPPRRAE